MIKFNERGYIEPADALETELEIFEQTFVFNDHRQQIFDHYKTFLTALQNLEMGNFKQWINGSFTTQKIKPNDIDVVTFVDFQVYKKLEKEFTDLKSAFRIQQIDSYFVAVFPNEHRDFLLFRSYELDFWHKFTRDFKREKILKQTIRKGFIQINFDHA